MDLGPVPGHVLVVDDDAAFVAMLATALRANGLLVETARDASAALERATRGGVSLFVIDWVLPGISGTELVVMLRHTGIHAPFVLVSGFATVRLTVEAMRLGALDVLQKPFDSSALIAVIRNALQPVRAADPRIGDRSEAAPSRGDVGTSAADRWVANVLRAANAGEDPKSLRRWSKVAGTSYTSLRDTCYVVGIQPAASRDFARALRVVLSISAGHSRLETLLDVPDRRALRRFFLRVGVDFHKIRPSEATLDDFLTSQVLIPAAHPVLTALRTALRNTPKRSSPRPIASN